MSGRKGGFHRDNRRLRLEDEPPCVDQRTQREHPRSGSPRALCHLPHLACCWCRCGQRQERRWVCLVHCGLGPVEEQSLRWSSRCEPRPPRDLGCLAQSNDGVSSKQLHVCENMCQALDSPPCWPRSQVAGTQASVTTTLAHNSTAATVHARRAGQVLQVNSFDNAFGPAAYFPRCFPRLLRRVLPSACLPVNGAAVQRRNRRAGG
jgi:hypothetical protein